jgi:hypothetical protein
VKYSSPRITNTESRRIGAYVTVASLSGRKGE